MDTIKLIKEIERKIREAEAYLPVLIAMLQQQEGLKSIQGQEELNLIYRIKDKKRILEKVILFSNKSGYEGMDENQILDSIGDIIGLTIVVDSVSGSYQRLYEMLGEINYNFERGSQPIEVKRFVDHISDDGGTTGYKCLLIQYDSKEGIPFEIQITDSENLKIREETHEEFERTKYEQVRNASRGQKVEDVSK